MMKHILCELAIVQGYHQKARDMYWEGWYRLKDVFWQL
jgi:hypothetical protein